MVPTPDRRRTNDGRSSIGRRTLGIVAIVLGVVVGYLIISEILNLIFDELLARKVPFDATAAGPLALAIGLGSWFVLVAGGVVADRHHDHHRRGNGGRG